MSMPAPTSPPAAPRRWLGFVGCFVLPLVARLIASGAFYGSTDTQNFLSAMEFLLKGGYNLFNYYTPSVVPEALGAVGGLALGIPMTAAFKMSHAVPDLLLAIWFYAKLVQANGGRPSPRIYLLTGLLHLAPSIVLVAHIHGQMDSWSILYTVVAIELFLQPAKGWAFAAGLAMSFGTGIKIFPLFLIPCFYLYHPWRWGHLITFSLGLVAGYGLYFSHAYAHPDYIWSITSGALKYESQPLMGIKGILWPYLEKLPGGAPPLRVFIVGALALAYLFAWLRRLDLYRSVLLALLAVMTVSFHMAPQYLLWPTFLLFFAGLYRTAVFYNLGSGALLIFYYYYTRDNSGAYTPLLPLEFLAPTRPHWFEQPYPLYYFNDRLRGPGIWWTIAIALLALVIDCFRHRQPTGRSALAAALVPLATRSRLFVGALVTMGVGYVLVLAFTWPSPFRHYLGRHFDATYYQRNYFSYGRDYLYEVTVRPVLDADGQPLPLTCTFSGNDFYVVFQNGRTLDGPHVGRGYPPHHAGIFGYRPVTHPLLVPGSSHRSADGTFQFWIIDGHGSIDSYQLPRITIAGPAGPLPPDHVQVAATRLQPRQVTRLFREWERHQVFISGLAGRHGVTYDLAITAGPDDGSPGPLLADATHRPILSVIGLLAIGLAGWTIAGALISQWNFRDSNT